MKPIEYHRLALREFQHEAQYYNAKQAGLGHDFQQEVSTAERRIRSNPQLFPLFGATQCRGCPVDRFPFTLYFAEFDDRIVIYGVAHHKRRPGNWTRRLSRN